jgi:hypothetical protein
MSHRYNLRPRKNIQSNEEKKNVNIMITLKPSPIAKDNLIEKDDTIFGLFNEPLCSNHFKEDLLNFITKWRELLPNISDIMIKNIETSDYQKDVYSYWLMNSNAYSAIKDQLAKQLSKTKSLQRFIDYDRVKEHFNIYICSEEFANLTINNTVKKDMVEYSENYLKKLKKVALKELAKNLSDYSNTL